MYMYDISPKNTSKVKTSLNEGLFPWRGNSDIVKLYPNNRVNFNITTMYSFKKYSICLNDYFILKKGDDDFLFLPRFTSMLV